MKWTYVEMAMLVEALHGLIIPGFQPLGIFSERKLWIRIMAAGAGIFWVLYDSIIRGKEVNLEKRRKGLNGTGNETANIPRSVKRDR